MQGVWVLHSGAGVASEIMGAVLKQLRGERQTGPAEVADFGDRLSKIETGVTQLKWMLATNIALNMLILGLLLRGH